MKKKILLFASSVLAAMALTVSAYAATPSATHDQEDDAKLILQEALQHTLAPGSADYSLYDIDGNKPDGLNPAVDVTANDAALAYKNYMTKKQFYLEIKAGKFTKDIVLTPYSGSVDSDEAGIKDMIENYLALDEVSKSQKAVAVAKEKTYNDKAKSKLLTYLDKIHFYSGSDKIGEVYLTKDLGWAIFASKVAPLLNGKDATLIAMKYDDVNKTAVGDKAKIAALDLPAVAADGDVTFKELQDAYIAARDQAVNLNAAEIPGNIKEAAENSMHVGTAYAKYGAKLVLNEGTKYEKTYEYKKDKDLTQFNKLVDDAAGLYDYNTVTIGKINDVLGTGDDFVEVETNGEKKKVFGTAKVTIGQKSGSIQLVQKK